MKNDTRVTSIDEPVTVERKGGARAKVSKNDLIRDFGNDAAYIVYVDTIVGYFLCDTQSGDGQMLATVYELRKKHKFTIIYWHSSEDKFTRQVMPSTIYDVLCEER